jgi:hypothetical protein
VGREEQAARRLRQSLSIQGPGWALDARCILALIVLNVHFQPFGQIGERAGGTNESAEPVECAGAGRQST